MVLQQHFLTAVQFLCLVDLVNLFEQISDLLVLAAEL